MHTPHVGVTPLGRRKLWEDALDGVNQEEPYRWWRRHDEYEPVASR